MKKNKIIALEKHGWKVGSAADFLNLSREEAAYVEMKLALARQLQKKRKSKHLTQQELAALIHSSQSRVAKMEKNDPTVSIDLLVKSLLALGSSPREVAKAISYNMAA
jgi:DNA-binding XRE family transcriptional regulator